MNSRYQLIALFLLVLSLLIGISSAKTIATIDIDDKGDSIFVGKTDITNLTLPQGIQLENGKIFGSTSELTTKNQEIWTFSYKLNNSEITLLLPNGAVIQQISNGEISSQNEQISIFARGGTELSYTINPSTTNSYNYYLIALGIVILIILIIVYIKNKQPKQANPEKKQHKQDKLRIINKILNEREKIIMNNLKKSGKIKMSHLRKLTEIPKASFSRHIMELEKKGLIKRSGEGKNKFVEIK